MDLRTADFDYELPDELIAQTPPPVRGGSRLLVVHRDTGELEHLQFVDLPSLLHSGDLLVANRSRVLPARLFAHKASGGVIELLLLRRLSDDRWSALVRPSRKVKPGMQLAFSDSPLTAVVESEVGEGEWHVYFEGVPDINAELQRVGEVPLPPYIRETLADPERYQTVYADQIGSVAAPTAGLHFSSQMLETLRGSGVATCYLTLHVGLGTFRPVTAERIVDHHMHSEWGEVSSDVAAMANSVRASGGRVVAVGTTTTRLLETASRNGHIDPYSGDTDIFIYPGYSFKAIDALLTNFHLPQSTLLMLVSAFAGTELIARAYREAVEQRYRFFSFGDAMLIV